MTYLDAKVLTRGVNSTLGAVGIHERMRAKPMPQDERERRARARHLRLARGNIDRAAENLAEALAAYVERKEAAACSTTTSS